MPDNAYQPAARRGFDDVEARRSKHSRRTMSPLRRFCYFVGLPLLRGLLRLLAATYRVEAILGAEHAARLLESPQPCGPCYWHQHHILCTGLVRRWIRRGFRASFLVSASVDGEVPARIARAWGAEVIRGSANQTGALVLRDLRETLGRGVSIVTTADGPNGPQHEFKPGAVLMARIAGVPLVPLACAAERAWYLRRWDRFMIPKPFTRVALAIGEPVPVPAATPLDKIEEYRLAMQRALVALEGDCRAALERRGR
jgi:lysophospholipid acyltransferase (LPLAT)-like uncharacterized protein